METTISVSLGKAVLEKLDLLSREIAEIKAKLEVCLVPAAAEETTKPVPEEFPPLLSLKKIQKYAQEGKIIKNVKKEFAIGLEYYILHDRHICLTEGNGICLDYPDLNNQAGQRLYFMDKNFLIPIAYNADPNQNEFEDYYPSFYRKENLSENYTGVKFPKTDWVPKVRGHEDYYLEKFHNWDIKPFIWSDNHCDDVLPVEKQPYIQIRHIDGYPYLPKYIFITDKDETREIKHKVYCKVKITSVQTGPKGPYVNYVFYGEEYAVRLNEIKEVYSIQE